MENAVDSYKVHPISITSPSKTKSRKQTLLQEARAHFKSYCNHTSIHGFQYFGQNRTILEKCWWTFIFICILSSCAFGIYLIYNKWQQSPVIVSLTTRDTPIYQVPFPAVTICPTIRFSKKCMRFGSLFKNISEGSLGIKNISKWEEKERKLLHYMIPLCKRNLVFLELMDEETSSKEIYEVIRDCSPFVSGKGISVRFMDSILSFNESFRPFLTEDGLCFSFNMLSPDDIFTNITELNRDYSDSSPTSSWIPQIGYSLDADLDTYPRRALLSGAANSLEIEIMHYDNDIDYVCSGAAQGYKVILHLPTRVPRPALEFNMAPFGKSTIITVDPHMMATSNVVKAYDSKKRDCYFEGEKYLKFFNIYSKTNCDFECVTNYTLKECGCVPFQMPRESSTPICGLAMQPCVSFTLEKYNLMKLRSKLKETRKMNGVLRSYTGFSAADSAGNLTMSMESNSTEDGISRRRRQIDSFSEDEEEDEARCSCLRSCNDITYKGAASSTDYKWRESTMEDSSKEVDFSLITVYLDTNVVFTTERNELYGPTDFLSNFGGLLGLFTGFSILSFMEIIYFCTFRIFGNRRIIGRWYGDKEE